MGILEASPEKTALQESALAASGPPPARGGGLTGRLHQERLARQQERLARQRLARQQERLARQQEPVPGFCVFVYVGRLGFRDLSLTVISRNSREYAQITLKHI